MNNLKSKLLVLDSGIGGLTVLQEIHRQLPGLALDYLADHQYLPYGGKSETQLEQRIAELLKHLNADQNYDVVVLACNSASTAVLDFLRKEFKVPFIGVVPAIKVAGEITRNNTIGLLATKGTVERYYTRQLIEDFASHCQVVKLAVPELVEFAERKFFSGQINTDALKEAVQPLIDNKVDTCVLGCTHFSWLQQDLSEVATDVRWVDSCDAIARRVNYVLTHELSCDQQPVAAEPNETSFITTDEMSNDLSSALHRSGFNFANIKVI